MLAPALRSRVHAVRVSHLNDDIETAFAVGPGSLVDFDGTRSHTYVTPAEATLAYRALALAEAKRSPSSHADLRWALAFRDVHGATLLVAFCDKFALDGYVGGNPVAFSHGPSLLDWLHAHDPLR